MGGKEKTIMNNINVGDIATIISAVIIGISAIISAVIMVCANNTAKKSVEITQKNTELLLILDLRKEYRTANDDNAKFVILERVAYIVLYEIKCDKFAKNSFRFDLEQQIKIRYIETKKNDKDIGTESYKNVRDLYDKWHPSYKISELIKSRDI